MTGRARRPSRRRWLREGAASRAAAAWAQAVEGAEAAQRVGVHVRAAAPTTRLAWADHDFSAGRVGQGEPGRRRRGRQGPRRGARRSREGSPADAALLRDALRSQSTAAGTFRARASSTLALMGAPGSSASAPSRSPTI